MKPWQYKLLLAVSAILISPLAQAHSNSLSTGLLAGLSHPLLGLDHLVALIMAGLLMGKLASARYLALGGFLLALGVGATAGILLGAQPWVEGAILLSIPVFLALQWAREKAQLKIATTVMGMFMVAHGWAHGVEMTGMNTSFIVGFLLSSAMIIGLSSLLGSTLSSHMKANKKAATTSHA